MTYDAAPAGKRAELLEKLRPLLVETEHRLSNLGTEAGTPTLPAYLKRWIVASKDVIARAETSDAADQAMQRAPARQACLTDRPDGGSVAVPR